MSLVAYDSSDGSENESDNEPNDSKGPQAVSSPIPGSALNPQSNGALSTSDLSGLLVNVPVKKGLFSQLPEPKHATAILPEDPISKLIPKKETVKIRIPSLKEFEDTEEEEMNKAKRKPSKLGSGLISMLPEPQNTTVKEAAKTLIPHSVSRKQASANLASNTKPPSILPRVPKSTSNPVVSNSVESPTSLQEDNASDEESLTDFFSLSGTKTSNIELPLLPEKSASFTNEEPLNNEKRTVTSAYMVNPTNESRDPDVSYFSNATYSGASYSTNSSLEHVSSYSSCDVYDNTNSQVYNWNASDPSVNSEVPTLKNEDFVRLAGKKRNAQESIEIVDVNGDDLVAGRDEWLLKSLSETSDYQPAPKRSDQPSAMHRRKHQITYLAFQAKAREQELKSQWSMNRMTKKQTQSKYGF